MVACHALLEDGGVGAGGEHALVVVALEGQDTHVPQQLERAVAQHARVGAVAQAVGACARLAVEAQAKGVGHVVRGGEGAHAHAAGLELVCAVHQLKRQRGEVPAPAGGAGRGNEPAGVALAEDGEAAHVVAVLVRHHDAANAVHVDAQLVGAAQQLAGGSGRRR